MTTDQSSLILVVDLPSSTFAPKLIIQPNEQTFLATIMSIGAVPFAPLVRITKLFPQEATNAHLP
jgi:hypothetical protein